MYSVMYKPETNITDCHGQNPNKNTCLTISENGMPKCPTKNHVPSLFDTSNLNML